MCISGCGSSSDTGTRAASNTSPAANSAAPVNAPVPGIPTNAAVPANDANVPSAGPLDMANRRKISDTNPNGPVPPPTRTPGPENSEFDTTMDKQGNFVEERFFKDHPVLIKAIRTLYGPNNSEVKVYLKSGKVVTIPGNKVDVLSKVQTSLLLSLAGVKMPAPPVQARPSTPGPTKHGEGAPKPTQ